MKKNKILIICIILLIIVIIGLGIYSILSNDNDDVSLNNDISYFIRDYESYNGQEVSEHDILNLELNEDVVIYIKTEEEILDIMQNEKALIYFGFSSCPWCRNMITALMEASNDKNQEIYYVDIQEIRNIYTIENNEVIESTKGVESYYKMLEFLGENLSDYIIYDEDGNSYDTKTTRLYGPTVITVKDGSLLDIKVGSLDTVTDPYIKLSDKEYEMLYIEFSNIINNLQIEACSIDKC